MKKDDNIDSLLDESLNLNLDNIELPNSDEMWKNIKKGIIKEQKKQKRVIYYKNISMVAAIVILSFTVFKPHIVNSRLVRVLKYYISEGENNTYKISISSNEESPKEVLMEVPEVQLNFEELNKIIEDEYSKYTLPTYIPEGYKFKEAVAYTVGDLITDIKIFYENKDGEKLELHEENILGEYTSDISINKSTGDIKKISIGNTDYHIIFFKNDFKILLWDKNEVKYTLEGTSLEEDMIKMADSIR
ncbi:DUF4367 domain-containing protein [Tissierella sp. MSJ-40]|uniref:DUF4367 domain-containing protein n=1 Tax=Tissierella simiarum TaxID=2841534 RepID=A0ABS6E8U4_9FIRM|nr:DUF4367 domain-containing protein [Tissierella simiarum]MBU5439342.1 DUF4367 domain-containing protein [Tissierella simiarum]